MNKSLFLRHVGINMRHINLFIIFLLFSFLLKAQGDDTDRLLIDLGFPDPFFPNASYVDDPKTDEVFRHAGSLASLRDSSYQWVWDIASLGWKLNGRSLYHYNPMQWHDTTTNQQVHDTLWTNSSRTIYTLDANGNVLDELDQSWSGGEWNNYYQYPQTYDADQNLTSIMIIAWWESQGDTIGRLLYSYDDRHNVITQLNQSWINHAWVNTILRVNDYDTDELLTYQLRRHWNTDWEDAFQYFYTYDSLQHLTQYVSEKRVGNEWVNNFRRSYAYDLAGNRIMFKTEIPLGDSWVNDDQFLYTYDDQHNRISETEQKYSTSEWINVDQHLYGYDQDQHLVSDVFLKWEDAWLNVDSSYHFYKRSVSSTGLTVQPEMAIVFPNPAFDFITIARGESFQRPLMGYLFSAQGQMIEPINLPAGVDEQIEVGHLSPGTYFLAVRYREDYVIAKFIRL